MANSKIFICDDEKGILSYLKKLLESQGLAVETFCSGSALLQRLREGGAADPELLLQDMKMPDMDGIQVLLEVKKIRPSLPVIIMTAFGSIDTAVEAIKLGAYDFVTKPFPKEKILSVVDNVMERELLIRENRELKHELYKPPGSNTIIFKSDTFREIYELTLQVAESDANILVLGESGTGKELIAGAIHSHSKRKNNRILSINCAALTDSLFGSQLFGHIRGAFTGAVSTQKGLLEEADGGTMFMDEIGDMSLAIQAKLLRAIQEQNFIPVGSTKPKNVNVRFVAATNKDLAREVSEGRFREDLYYRLNVITISLPPLRERREDIEPLVRHFIGKHSKKMAKHVSDVTPAALELLNTYNWPGNIRELENVIERAVILSRGNAITAENLPLWKNMGGTEAAPEQNRLASLENVELEHIKRILKTTGYHKSKTAEILGISRKTLDRKIAEFSLNG